MCDLFHKIVVLLAVPLYFPLTAQIHIQNYREEFTLNKNTFTNDTKPDLEFERDNFSSIHNRLGACIMSRSKISVSQTVIMKWRDRLLFFPLLL